MGSTPRPGCPPGTANRPPRRTPGWRRRCLENEVNLAVVAEQRLGVVRDRDTSVLLWPGHGVGAAVVLDGVLRRGASGGTGEIGFLPLPGTTAVSAVLDPGCAVLGGEVGRAGGTALAHRVEAHVARMSPLRTEVRPGAVGGGAVLRGAVLTATDAAQNDLFGAGWPSPADPIRGPIPAGSRG